MRIVHQGPVPPDLAELAGSLSSADTGKAWTSGADLYLWTGASFTAFPNAIG